jgi:hypothetical protein
MTFVEVEAILGRMLLTAHHTPERSPAQIVKLP